jgi:hypothetical protein
VPVFHFTLHAYRSWNADNPRGYLQHDQRGVQDTNERLARARDRLARFPAVRFEVDEARYLVEQAADVVRRRGWDLYCVTVIESHMHIVVGWRQEMGAKEVQTGLKRGFGYLLAERRGTEGRPYFSHGGVPEQVRHMKHLRYLIETYLPDHHGPIWCAKLG